MLLLLIVLLPSPPDFGKTDQPPQACQVGKVTKPEFTRLLFVAGPFNEQALARAQRHVLVVAMRRMYSKGGETIYQWSFAAFSPADGLPLPVRQTLGMLFDGNGLQLASPTPPFSYPLALLVKVDGSTLNLCHIVKITIDQSLAKLAHLAVEDARDYYPLRNTPTEGLISQTPDNWLLCPVFATEYWRATPIECEPF